MNSFLAEVDERIVNQINLSSQKGKLLYHIPLIEEIDSKNGYAYILSIFIEKEDDIAHLKEVSQIVGKDIKEKYGNTLYELFFTTLNCLFAYSNKEVIDISELEYLNDDSDGDEFSYLEALERTLKLLLMGTYEFKDTSLDIEGITYGEIIDNRDDNFDPLYVVIPVIDKLGVAPIKEGNYLDFSFRTISVETRDEIIARLLKVNEQNSISARQNRAKIKRIKKNSTAVGYYVEAEMQDEINELLPKLGSDWCDLIGVDLSAFKE